MLKALVNRFVLGGHFQDKRLGTTGVKHMVAGRSDLLTLLELSSKDRSVGAVLFWMVLAIEDTIKLSKHNKPRQKEKESY